MEVRCREGDILVFGLGETPFQGITAQELVDQVHKEGGVVIPAHPFRSSAPSLGKNIFEIRGLDAIEVLNGNSSDQENQAAYEAAQELHLPCTGGSDAHSKNSVGRYITEFEDDHINDEWELINALKRGRYQPKQLFAR
jgi:PHP family Zn ribbon phosphoesterase